MATEIQYSNTPEQPQGCTLNFINELSGEVVSLAFGYLAEEPTMMMMLVGNDGPDRLIAIPREVLEIAIDQGWAEE
jgi:hypothetical protein